MKLQIKITHKLLHNSRATDLYPAVEIGTIRANVTTLNIHGAPVVRLGKANFDTGALAKLGWGATPTMVEFHVKTGMLPIIRERVVDFIKDGNSKYPIVWSEDNCIETEIRELA